MDENLTKECFLTLADRAVSALEGDALMEEHGRYDYTVTRGETAAPSDDISSCHKCDACFLRRIYAEPVLQPGSAFLFVLPYPEGDTLLSSESRSYFTKWIAAMGYDMKSVSLSALIKCPVQKFTKESADICKDYLRDEMKRTMPRAIVLLGEDTAIYMLRRTLPLDSLRLHTYRINGIPAFCTYSPSDLVKERALRARIWEDLQYIRDQIKSGGGTA